MARPAKEPSRRQVLAMRVLLLSSGLAVVPASLSGQPLLLAAAFALFGIACVVHVRLRGDRWVGLMAAGLFVATGGIVLDPWSPSAGLLLATLGTLLLAVGLGVFTWRSVRGTEPRVAG